MKVKWMGSPDFIHSSPENKSKQIIGVGDESNDLDTMSSADMFANEQHNEDYVEMDRDEGLDISSDQEA